MLSLGNTSCQGIRRSRLSLPAVGLWNQVENILLDLVLEGTEKIKQENPVTYIQKITYVIDTHFIIVIASSCLLTMSWQDLQR